MKNLKVILALTMAITFVITSCNKEELSQNSTTTIEELSSKTTDNAFIDLVTENVYPVNLLRTTTIQKFSKSIVMLEGQIASANGSILKADLNEDQINLFFDVLAEQRYQRANADEGIESRAPCAFFKGAYNSQYGGCIKKENWWCGICPTPPIEG